MAPGEVIHRARHARGRLAPKETGAADSLASPSLETSCGDLDVHSFIVAFHQPSRTPTRRFTELSRGVHSLTALPVRDTSDWALVSPSEKRPSTRALLLSKPRARVSRGFEISFLSHLIRGSASFRRLRHHSRLLFWKFAACTYRLIPFSSPGNILCPGMPNTLLFFLSKLQQTSTSYAHHFSA